MVATDGGGYYFGSGPTKSTPTKRTKTIFVESNSPDKCDTDFDAVAVIRSEMWAFKSRHFWRIHRDRGKRVFFGDFELKRLIFFVGAKVHNTNRQLFFYLMKFIMWVHFRK